MELLQSNICGKMNFRFISSVSSGLCCVQKKNGSFISNKAQKEKKRKVVECAHRITFT